MTIEIDNVMTTSIGNECTEVRFKTHYRVRLDFQKGDQHTDDKWLIHGTKRHKDNQLQSMEPPVESRENKLLLFQWSCKPRPYVSIVEIALDLACSLTVVFNQLMWHESRG